MCGKILADLGADVIKVERPGGDPARLIGPFYRGEVDAQKSLFWFAFNANKRGITLDAESEDGQEIFLRLIETADVVVESFAPGYLDKLGLGYSMLRQIKPSIILTSITPFGQTGPHASHPGYGIELQSLSGFTYLLGWPDSEVQQPHGAYTDSIVLVSFFATMRCSFSLNPDCLKNEHGLGIVPARVCLAD